MSEKVDLEVVKKFMRDFLEAVESDGYVKVVRCKECKWRHDDSNPQHLPCTDWYPPDDFFCADGERREDVRND